MANNMNPAGASIAPWTGTTVWEKNSFNHDDQWLITLSPDEIADIDSVIQESVLSSKPIRELTKDDFGFTSFGQRLLELRADILDGTGFSVLRGLPGDWSDEKLIRTYWGVGRWLGDPVSQNAQGHLLGHVIDRRSSPTAGTRIYQTNQAQPFHSDSCDIVGLLCLRKANQGGASYIASSTAIHNKMLSTDIEALQSLYGEFQCDRYGEIPDGKQPSYAVHVFNDVEGKCVCCGMDPDIRSAQRLNTVTALTQKQNDALDRFQTIAQDLALSMSLQRGDIQLLNNHVVVHAREQFQDDELLDKRRYLVRLWLSASNGRKLPAFMKERWGNIEVGSLRGGINVSGVTPTVTLNAG
ncbi:MAG: hypothetical protein ACI9UN_000677 [Granulosicoccus sp.]|jgi:hypothetical protein